MKKTKKVQLVLGGGGARGIAHIKVIELLRRDGFEIESVVGCSMGAVVGGIYCTGHMDAYRDWLLTLNRSKLFQLMDFTLTNMGFLKGERVLGKMHELTGDQLIEDLQIPFVAVATDLVHGSEVYFREGDLYSAMRASISIPGVFTPVVHKDSVLVDGGVLNPLPLNLTDRETTESLVVAVSLNGRSELPEGEHVEKKDAVLEAGTTTDSIEPPPAGEPVALSHKRWLQRLGFQGRQRSENDLPRFSLVDLLTNSYEFTQDKLVELSIQTYQPDILIDIPRSSCGLFDFHKGAHMLEVGEQSYEKAMEAYRMRAAATESLPKKKFRPWKWRRL